MNEVGAGAVTGFTGIVGAAAAGVAIGLVTGAAGAAGAGAAILASLAVDATLGGGIIEVVAPELENEGNGIEVIEPYGVIGAA